MKPIIAIAKTTVGEAVRRKVLLIILMIGVLLLTIIPSLSVLSARSETSTMIATMFAVLRFTSMLIAIVLTIYMIPNEIERRTIYTILSKPVQRWQFLVGKYLGAVFSLFLMILLMTIVMVVLFKWIKGEEATKLIEMTIQSGRYFLEMSLLAAVAIFFSTFTTPLVNFFLSIGIWGVGTVLNPLYSSLASNSQTIPLMKTVAGAITGILPNFANYDVKNPIINPGQVIENPLFYNIYITGYAIVYILVLLIAGMLIFEKREV
jgi:ABC-type transport system involved in multi-copper enzyme maturation permease subunit